MKPFKKGQKVKVLNVHSHDGVGIVHDVKNTHGRHGNIYTVIYQEKMIQINSKTINGKEVTLSERKVPQASMVFGHQLQAI